MSRLTTHCLFGSTVFNQRCSNSSPIAAGGCRKNAKEEQALLMTAVGPTSTAAAEMGDT